MVCFLGAIMAAKAQEPFLDQMKPSSDAVSVKQVTNVLWQYLVGFSFVCVLRSRNVQHRFPLQEASWLKDVHNFVIGQVCPLLGVPGSSVDNNTLTGASVRRLPVVGQ